MSPLHHIKCFQNICHKAINIFIIFVTFVPLDGVLLSSLPALHLNERKYKVVYKYCGSPPSSAVSCGCVVNILLCRSVHPLPPPTAPPSSSPAVAALGRLGWLWLDCMHTTGVNGDRLAWYICSAVDMSTYCSLPFILPTVEVRNKHLKYCGENRSALGGYLVLTVHAGRGA